MITERTRKQRKFWAVTQWGAVQHVTGYDCEPDMPNYWWVPELGSSMLIGFHLFDTELEAINRGIFEQKDKRAEAEEMLRRLEERKMQL